MSVFDYAWGLMNEHYAFFELHGVDWEARRKMLRPRVRQDMGEAELFDLLEEMLSGLVDAHLTLEATIGGADMRYDGGGPTRRLDPALDAAFAEQTEIKGPRRVRDDVAPHLSEQRRDDSLGRQVRG